MKYCLMIFVIVLVSFVLSTEVKTDKKKGETIMDYMAENILTAPVKNATNKKKKKSFKKKDKINQEEKV